MVVHVQRPAFNLREKINEIGGPVSPSRMPKGSVIQHVRNQTRGGGHLSTTSGSFVDLSYSVSITPHFSNSLMLIEWSGIAQQPNTVTGVSVATIYRNNTTNLGDTAGFYGMSATGDFSGSGGVFVTASNNFFVYDNPQTTSATTYNLWGKTSNGGTAYVSHNGVTTCLSVKEIRQ